MPHYHVDPEFLEEMGAPGGDENFYEPAQVDVSFARLGRSAQLVRDALVEKGFSEVLCRYDGGYDEGFAYFEHAVADGRELVTDDLVTLFEHGSLAEASLLVPEDGPYPPAVREQWRRNLENTPPRQRIAGLLEEFADELASELLGRGYGTGEMSLHGRFRTDLATGRTEDLEEAGPPPLDVAEEAESEAEQPFDENLSAGTGFVPRLYDAEEE